MKLKQEIEMNPTDDNSEECLEKEDSAVEV